MLMTSTMTKKTFETNMKNQTYRYYMANFLHRTCLQGSNHGSCIPDLGLDICFEEYSYHDPAG